MNLNEMADILDSENFKEHMKKIFIQRVERENYSKDFKDKLNEALENGLNTYICPNNISIELLRDALKQNGVEFTPKSDVYGANLSSLWSFFCGGIFVIDNNDFGSFLRSEPIAESIAEPITEPIVEPNKLNYEDKLTNFKYTSPLSSDLPAAAAQAAGFPKTRKYKRKKTHKNRSIKRKSRKKTRKQKGGGDPILQNNNSLVRSIPTWRGQTLITLKNDYLLYGTSSPGSINAPLFETLKFYMYNIGIKKLVSLQACEVFDEKRNQPYNAEIRTKPYNDDISDDDNYDCSGYTNTNYDKLYDENRPINAEEKIWDLLKGMSDKTSNDDEIEYIAIPIQDMTCGDVTQWIKFSQLLPFSNSTIIHCLAGFGRTGSFLFYSLLYSKGIFEKLKEPFFGQSTSTEMFNGLGKLAEKNILQTTLSQPKYYNPLDPFFEKETSLINSRIVASEPIRSIDELFNITSLMHINLFIQRINRMILTIMLSEFNYDLSNIDGSIDIYLYGLHSTVVDKSNIFVPLQQAFDSNLSMERLIRCFNKKL